MTIKNVSRETFLVVFLVILYNGKMIELQVGVKILLKNKENKYLLVKRASMYGHLEGSWDIPGGRINPGDTLLANLQREVKEEVNLDITGVPKLIYAQDIFVKDKNRHVVRLTFLGEASGETIILDTKENSEWQWLGFHEMRTCKGIDPYLKEVIEAYFGK